MNISPDVLCGVYQWPPGRSDTCSLEPHVESRHTLPRLIHSNVPSLEREKNN